MGSFLFLLTCLVPIWSPDSLVASAFGTGLTFTVLVQMFDSVSGGHINPSITLSLLMNGQIPIIKGAMYISVQMLGGVAGSAFVNWSTEDFPKETPGEDVFDRLVPASYSKNVYLLFFVDFLIIFQLTNLKNWG